MPVRYTWFLTISGKLESDPYFLSGAAISGSQKAPLSLEQFITLAIQTHPSVASKRAGLYKIGI